VWNRSLSRPCLTGNAIVSSPFSMTRTTPARSTPPDRVFMAEHAGQIIGVIRLAPEPGGAGVVRHARPEGTAAARHWAVDALSAAGRIRRRILLLHSVSMARVLLRGGGREIHDGEAPAFLAARRAHYVDSGQDVVLMRRSAG
jgi:hypothetical protein